MGQTIISLGVIATKSEHKNAKSSLSRADRTTSRRTVPTERGDGASSVLSQVVLQ
jgi:hypothetical protein